MIEYKLKLIVVVITRNIKGKEMHEAKKWQFQPLVSLVPDAKALPERIVLLKFKRS
jgi:hypothetical protein